MIGLRAGTIELVPYSPQWETLFQEERNRLTALLGQDVLDIQHIGSTAIAGMVAKPIIDIAIAVITFEAGVQCVERIESLGYIYRGEHGIPGRHYFIKGNPRTHHLHMVEIDSDDWRDNLLFRDYLHSHPDTAERYAALKQELAAKYATDRRAYTESEAPFIQEALRLAKSNGVQICPS